MKKLAILLFAILIVIFVAGCVGTKANTDLATLNGEQFINMDADNQTAVVEELMKTVNPNGVDHTSKYFVSQLNSFYGGEASSKRLVKDVFNELTSSNKSADQLSIIDGFGWAHMTKDQKIAVIQQESKNIAEKNPAFSPKSPEEYLNKIEEVYKSADPKIKKLPVNTLIQKVLTNNIIIDGVLVK